MIFHCEQKSDDHDHDERHQYRCCRQRLIIQTLELIVHEVLQHIDGIVRIIRCQQIDLTEDLKRADQGHDRNKQKGGRQIPDLNIEKGL